MSQTNSQERTVLIKEESKPKKNSNTDKKWCFLWANSDVKFENVYKFLKETFSINKNDIRKEVLTKFESLLQNFAYSNAKLGELECKVAPLRSHLICFEEKDPENFKERIKVLEAELDEEYKNNEKIYKELCELGAKYFKKK